MKTPHLNQTISHAGGRGRLAATASLLLASLPLAAGDPTTFTGAGYLVGVPVPGILCTNAAGQVALKGNVHVLRVQTDDPRSTGRFQAGMDLVYQTDVTALFRGAAHQEVGTWNLSDPAHPGFTPTGGVWDMLYAGEAQADGSDVITLTGYGVGGAIDGLRIEETITKGPGVPFDPTVPYVGSGTISPAPVDTRVVLDDFDDNKVTQWNAASQDGAAINLREANGRFTLSWRKLSPLGWVYAAGWRTRPWKVEPGKSLEWRVELVSLSEHANASAIEIKQDDSHAYFFIKAHDHLMIGKWLDPDKIVLSCEKSTLPNTNILLSGTMTRTGTGLVLTLRLLDKANPGLVLQEMSAMDTPGRDPTLDAARIEALTGMRLEGPADGLGAPYFSGDRYFLAVIQYAAGGALPPAEATFDNLELRTYDLPPVGIQRAVQLTWPAPTDVHYAVEGAPTVHGPWLPVQEAATPGVRQMTVPANDAMKVFRVR
jgi:hypothetical protein